MAHPHSNLVRQIDNVEINIANLAALTAVLGPSRIDAARENGFRTVVQEGTISLDGTVLSAPTGGPVMVGFTTDLSLVELNGAIENDPQDSMKVNNEDATKKIFVLGYLHSVNTGGNANASMLFKKKFQLSIHEGETMQFFAYNTDLTESIPDTSQVKIFCEHLGVWLRD